MRLLSIWRSSKASQRCFKGGDNRVSVYGARALFDGLLNDFPQKSLSQLRRNAEIVNNPDFENALVKLQIARESELTAREETAVRKFLKEAAVEETPVDNYDDADDVGYAMRILNNAESNKRARTDKSKYRSTQHVTATSNLCERLFSLAKLIMSYLRKHMDPDHLEWLLFLKANKNLWLSKPQLIQDILDNAPPGDGISDEV